MTSFIQRKIPFEKIIASWVQGTKPCIRYQYTSYHTYLISGVQKVCPKMQKSTYGKFLLSFLVTANIAKLFTTVDKLKRITACHISHAQNPKVIYETVKPKKII